MDNQNYKRLQKMLMHGVSSIEEDEKEEEIESELPRYMHAHTCMHMHAHTHMRVHIYHISSRMRAFY